MRTAVVVVDMLNDFVDGVVANPASEAIINPIASLVGRARSSHGWTVVSANDAHRPSDIELRAFPPHAMAGTRGAAAIGALQPQTGDLVVPKRFYSAFTETDLHARLRALDAGRLVLVGHHADCCIRHTGYEAFARAYELIVCPDATTVLAPAGDVTAADRQHQALEYLQGYYGTKLEAAGAVG